MNCKALKIQIRRRLLSKMLNCVFLLIVWSVVGVSFAKSAGNASTTSIPKPFFFTENKGQWDERVLYKCDAGGGLVWFLERDGFTLLTTAVDKTLPLASGGTQGGVRDPMDRDLSEMFRRHPPRYPLKGHALKFKFVKEDIPPLLPPNGVRGDNLSPSQAGGRGGVYLPASAKYFEGLGELPWKNNYFLGKDSTKWAPNCRNFTSVYYKDVWEGIDIEWYESNGKLEFDFVVQPGADPEQIRIAVEGLEGALSLSPAVGGTQGGVDIAIGQKESHPPLVPPAQQGGKVKNDGGIDSTPLPTVSRTVEELNSPPEPHQLKGTEGDISTPPKSHKPVSRTADKWGEYKPIKNPPVNGWDRISNPTTIMKGENNPPAVRGGFRGGQTVGDELILPTSLGELRTVLPKVYQIDGSGHVIDIPAKFQLIGDNDKRIHPPIAPPFTGGKANVPIAGENRTDSNTDKSFEINNTKTTNIFGVTLPEGYDPAHPLRIDPLIYSTFLGGESDDFICGIVRNESGVVFVTGGTSSYSFPIAGGGFPFIIGWIDGFVSCLNSTLSQLLYSTYIGGTLSDYPNSIIMDEVGGFVIAGGTNSSGYPVTANAFDTSHNGGYDCFVTKFNNTGTALIYSTFLGDNGDDGSVSIIRDSLDQVLVLGETTSANFPTTLSGYDRTHNGGYDCFVTRISASGSQLLYSTFIGGSNNDNSVNFGVDPLNGDIFIIGKTGSQDFPTTANAYNTVFNGGTSDYFITRLSSSGIFLVFSTFFGGSGNEAGGWDFAIDSFGRIVICGVTTSMDFPLTENAFDSTYSGNQDCFLSCFNSLGNQLVYSTYVGGSSVDNCSRLAPVGQGDVMLLGYSTSRDFPITGNAYDTTFNGGTLGDCFVSKFNLDSGNLLYSSFLGGSDFDGGYAFLALSPNEVIIAGETGSTDFPVTPLGYQIIYNGDYGDGFISQLQLIADTTDVILYQKGLPFQYSLSQNYPNPFNSTTILDYTVPKQCFIQLKLYDIAGRMVSTLVNRQHSSGYYQVKIHGSGLSSGVYYIQMTAKEFNQTRKIVLMK